MPDDITDEQIETALERARASAREIVYCTYCHKTHAVLATETPCKPGAWRKDFLS